VKIVNSDNRVGPLAILNAEAYCRHRLLIFAKVIGFQLPLLKTTKQEKESEKKVLTPDFKILSFQFASFNAIT